MRLKAVRYKKLKKEDVKKMAGADFNIEMPYGFIYASGGILSRLFYGEHQIYDQKNDEWVAV